MLAKFRYAEIRLYKTTRPDYDNRIVNVQCCKLELMS